VFGDKSVSGVPAIHHPLRNVEASTGELGMHSTRMRWAAATTALLALAAIVAGISIFTRYRMRPTLAASEKSIAVLPFDNLSSDKENAYFTDGVQDEILTDLAKIADLKVISRTSVLGNKQFVERLTLGFDPRNGLAGDILERTLLRNALSQDTAGFVEGVAGFCDVVDSERVRSATALRNKVAAAGGVGTRGLAQCRAVGLGPSCGHGRAGYGRAARVFNGNNSVHADLVILHQSAGEIDTCAAQRGGG
jgi:hypothetical protein